MNIANTETNKGRFTSLGIRQTEEPASFCLQNISVVGSLEKLKLSDSQDRKIQGTISSSDPCTHPQAGQQEQNYLGVGPHQDTGKEKGSGTFQISKAS